MGVSVSLIRDFMLFFVAPYGHSRAWRQTALPKESYEQAKMLAPLFNTLVDRVSRDGPWLKKVLADVLVSLQEIVEGRRKSTIVTATGCFRR